MQGVRALGTPAGNLVGPAFTLRYIPAREDRDSYGVKPDPNGLQREAIEAVPAGHVLVMDCRCDPRAASAGDVYVTRLQVRGVAGLVSDGGIRDAGPISRMGFPVFCAGPSAPSNRIRHRAIAYGEPFACGGVAVYPDDVIFRGTSWMRWHGILPSRRCSKPSSASVSRMARRCPVSIP
jgi:regulator of RNase E activity RraA